MWPSGQALRLLAAIVQIVTLLAFALSAPVAHARHDHGHQAHKHQAHGHQGHDPALHAVTITTMSVAPEADQDGTATACAHACCHHVFAAAPEGPVQPLRWAGSAGMIPDPTAAYVGVTPEALPEPPRSRA